MENLDTLGSLALGDTALEDTCYNSSRQQTFLPQNSDSGKQRILMGIIPPARENPPAVKAPLPSFSAFPLDLGTMDPVG